MLVDPCRHQGIDDTGKIFSREVEMSARLRCLRGGPKRQYAERDREDETQEVHACSDAHQRSPGRASMGLAYHPDNRVARSRSALPITLTEDSAIAAAAMIGDSRMPNAG